MTEKRMQCVSVLEEQTYDVPDMKLVPLFKATLHEPRELSRVEWWSNEPIFKVGGFYKVAIIESDE